jgi:hypothetical protein
MTTANDLLLDGFGRVRDGVRDVVAGLDEEALAFRPDPRANSIAWLVWHLTRVQDDHVAGVADAAQLWSRAGWVERFGLPFNVDATGYGHTAQEAGQVRATAELLAGYQDAVHDSVAGYLGSLTDADYPRVVDERWAPPVTLAVRLVSVLDDAAQHVGQAAYVRGLLERARG